jgi:hypothetical protein
MSLLFYPNSIFKLYTKNAKSSFVMLVLAKIATGSRTRGYFKVMIENNRAEN